MDLLLREVDGGFVPPILRSGLPLCLLLMEMLRWPLSGGVCELDLESSAMLLLWDLRLLCLLDTLVIVSRCRIVGAGVLVVWRLITPCRLYGSRLTDCLLP